MTACLKTARDWLLDFGSQTVRRAFWIGFPIAVTLGGLGNTAAVAAQPVRPRYQAVWVDAFNEGFKTREQTSRLVAWARRNCVNALFVEVRKAGDAYYRSRLEPVAADVSPSDYDPLSDLLHQAHDTRGGHPRIEVHAWLIIYRVGVGKPVSRYHVLSRHPQWRSFTYSGRRSSDNGHVHLDPGVPEVIDHTAHVVADLVSRYDLDGIHFDRIRYPDKQWGYNAVALSRFRRHYRRLRKPRPTDAEWAQFRREQIDAMLRRLYITTKSRRPWVKVSAATIAFDDCPSDFRQSRAYSDVFQDWRSWVRHGWLDLNCLMIYKREEVPEQAMQYRKWLRFLEANRGVTPAIVGQGSFVNAPLSSVRQISLALQHPGIEGTCLFSYAQMAREGESNDRLPGLLRYRYFGRNVATPRTPSPGQSGLGWLAGSVTGDTRDHLLVTLSTNPPRSAWTDGSGFFAFNRVPVGQYRVSTGVSRRRTATQSVSVTAEKVAWTRLAP